MYITHTLTQYYHKGCVCVVWCTLKGTAQKRSPTDCCCTVGLAVQEGVTLSYPGRSETIWVKSYYPNAVHRCGGAALSVIQWGPSTWVIRGPPASSGLFTTETH